MPEQEYQIVTGIVVTIIIFLLAGFFIVALVAYINERKKKHIEEKQSMELNFQEELLRTQLEIQEQTLKNISQEIHDNIGQVLSLAKLNLGTMNTGEPEKLQQKIDASKNLVSKAIQDLRDLSKSLNSDYVEEVGLAKAVEYEMEIIKRLGLFEIRFELSGSIYRAERKKELILFRIIQEGISNIIKHAQAKKIHVMMYYRPETLEIYIQDDGIGYMPGAMPDPGEQRSGLGIKNMYNRARMINADFKIAGVKDEGTILEIKLKV